MTTRNLKLKLVIILPLIMTLSAQVNAQRWDYQEKPVKCGEVFVDLMKGTLNGVKPGATHEEARKAFPECTEAIDAMERRADHEENLSNSRGFRFYFGSEMVEVWKGFKGRTSVKLLGKKMKVLDDLFGKPEIRGEYHAIYKTDYGSLYVNLDDKKKVDMFSLHSTTVDETWEFICMDSANCR